MRTTEYTIMSTVEQTHWWFVTKRQFFERIIERNGMIKGGSATIADIGAGTGGATSMLRKFGTVIGIEPNAAGRALARKGGIVLRNATAERTGLATHSCDLVCFFDVLYHKNIREKEVLREAFRILKPNGLLMVSDCAFPFLMSPHDASFGAARRYTIATLSKGVLNAGFSIHYKTYAFFLLFPFFVIWRLGQSIYHKFFRRHAMFSDVSVLPMWLNSMLHALCMFELPGYGYISYPWGSSVIMIAQKGIPE